MVTASIGSPVLWIGFTAFILLMLAFNSATLHRKKHGVGVREAAIWSAVWIALAFAFNAGIWVWHGPQPALEFFSGYVVEKTLSVDTLFVLLTIFSSFAVPSAYQHRVLSWGIVTALAMRAGFILGGAVLLDRFHSLIYPFGGVLVLTGILTIRSRHRSDAGNNPVVKTLRRLVPMSTEYRGERFFTRQGVRWVATPLFLVLVAVAASDVLFAVDSIPAIFAITQDPFLVFTSNIFALLGLHSLYFVLASVMNHFTYLKVGLGMVLVFVGGKMLLAEIYKVPTVLSTAIIASLIGASILLSWRRAASGQLGGAQLAATGGHPQG
jgi:tellurite resistance protein TerC